MKSLVKLRAVAPARFGFTIAELVIAVVLFGMVMAVVTQVLTRQQRFHRGASTVVEMRGQIRHAAYALPADLRPIFPAGDDITSWSSSSIGFRAFTGSSIACVKPNATTLVVPPMSLAKGNTLTSWLTAPVVGDSILILDENAFPGAADDVWRAHRISAIANAAGLCPEATGFTIAADAAKLSTQLTIVPAMSGTIARGAPIRVFRQVTYELYEASDGEHYLGAADCLSGRSPECSALAPIGGPFLGLTGDPETSGVSLRYFDVAGTELDPAADDPSNIVRIDIVIRAARQTPFGGTAATGTFGDSTTFTIGLRNR